MFHSIPLSWELSKAKMPQNVSSLNLSNESITAFVNFLFLLCVSACLLLKHTSSLSHFLCKKLFFVCTYVRQALLLATNNKAQWGISVCLMSKNFRCHSFYSSFRSHVNASLFFSSIREYISWKKKVFSLLLLTLYITYCFVRLFENMFRCRYVFCLSEFLANKKNQ